jgi:hypothetical protein
LVRVLRQPQLCHGDGQPIRDVHFGSLSKTSQC